MSDLSKVMPWVHALEDALFAIPQDIRSEVLETVLQREKAEEKEAEANGGLVAVTNFKPLTAEEAAALQASHEAAAVIVQVLVRSISNDNSQEDAADYLYRTHRHGTGSGRLIDYLPKNIKP